MDEDRAHRTTLTGRQTSRQKSPCSRRRRGGGTASRKVSYSVVVDVAVEVKSVWVKRPRSLLRYRRRRASRRDPHEPRSSRGRERQRLRAIALVSDWRAEIHALARRYDVCAEAIAGAVLWDALENPIAGGGCDSGRARSIRASSAARATPSGPRTRAWSPSRPSGAVGRLRILRRPEGALAYIAAILAHHTANYETTAGVDIRADAGVLCRLTRAGPAGHARPAWRGAAPAIPVQGRAPRTRWAPGSSPSSGSFARCWRSPARRRPAQSSAMTPLAMRMRPMTVAPMTTAVRPLRPIQALNRFTRSCVPSGAKT